MTIERPVRRVNAVGDLIVFERGGKATAVRLPRHGVAALGGLAALAFLWSMAAGAYILFHDTVVTELRQGARASATGYEAQIADLKNELERVRTRRLVEQTGAEQRLQELARRQETLEKRQATLSDILDPAAITGALPGDNGAPALPYTAKPTPLGGRGGPFERLDAHARRSEAATRAETLSRALDRMEQTQAVALEIAAAKTAERRRRILNVYAEAGVPGPKLEAIGGRGGPYVPLPDARGFEARARAVALEIDGLNAARRGLDAVPVRSPAPAGASVSSSFGARVDPFLGQPAFHAGIDFEADVGLPIRATAAGRVTAATYSGGYGLMVEIDHGGGLSTRFGHMSSIAVREGQMVRPGAILGRVGSTGRSTGPHLHYETRINGDAVNPLRFLKAGRTLATID
ncbi:peptidoglycan DD-metalloendopeptidase family protein [Methylopila musalis]|uniref:Peptidoglycan DD-metalloendopeptidase family protein n=1 Tax=Methylopila musalis TaxID=1134781 RepID=A0ABW3Z4I1_9HYPH